MKKVFQIWHDYRYPKSLRNEQDQQVYVLKLILAAAFIVLFPFTVIIVVGAVRGSLVFPNWRDLLVSLLVVIFGYFLVLRGYVAPVRYLLVFSMVVLGLGHTIRYGLGTNYVSFYLVALLFSYMIIGRRVITILVIIITPVLVDIVFNWGPGYDKSQTFVYLGFSVAIGLLLGVNKKIFKIFEDERNLVMEVEKVRQASASVMTSLDLQETIRKILDQLTKIVPHDSACVLLMRDEDAEMEIVGGHGWGNVNEIIGLRFPVPGNNPNTVIMETGKALILGNAPENYSEFRKEPHNLIKSWLGVPLLHEGNVIGMMAMDSFQPNYFSEDHVRVVSSFADHVSIAIENSLLYEIANQSVKRRAILHQASQDVIKASADLEEIYLAIHSAASRLMPCEAFAITLIKQDVVEGVYLIDQGNRHENVFTAFGTGLSGIIIGSKSSLIIPDTLESETQIGVHFGGEKEVRSLVAVPLEIGGDVIGMLTAQSYNPADYNEDDLNLLEMLGATAAIAIRNAQLLAEVEHLARTDSLTGLLNRRAFDEKLVYEISRSTRYNYPLSLLIIDVDDFKQFNDKFGHSLGDEHLKSISNLILESVRQPDMVARIGGEEFTVIIPHTTKQGGIKLAERIRKAVANEFNHGADPGSTVSIGVATYPEDATTIKTLYIAADDAMFAAKDSGKNKVISAQRSTSVN